MPDLAALLPALGAEAIVVRNVELKLDPEQVYRAQGIAPGRVSPAVKAATEALLPEVRRLLDPIFCCRILTVAGAQPRQVTFAEGFSFHGRLPSRLFAPAAHVFAAVCTVGAAVDRRTADLSAAGDIVEAFIVAAAASAAVGEVKAVAHALARAWAEDRRLRTGTVIAPSNRAWPLADQRVFAGMLPLGELGLELTDALMLRPTKSASMALAIGEQVDDRSSCDYCEIKTTCLFRE